MSKRHLLLAGLVLVASPPALYLATAPGRPAPDGEARPPTAAPVVACVGYVEPVTEVRRLAFKADGVIARCDAEVGRAYRKGDALMSLDDRDEAAAVAVAAAGLRVREAERDKALSGAHPALVEAAGASVRLFHEQFRFYRAELARLEPLLARNSTSRAEFDRMFTEVQQCAHRLARAEAELASLKGAVRPEDVCLAEARVAEARELLALARQRLADTTLRAPFDGVVLEVLRREGEAARAADPEPAAVFADTSRLRVRVEVDDRHVAALAAGQKAVVSGRGLGDRTYPGHVVLVKAVMGKKTVFTRSASERKDLDVVQAFVETDEPLTAPAGLEVEVVVSTEPRPPAPQSGGLIR
jgi:HlyD family secretion protein